MRRKRRLALIAALAAACLGGAVKTGPDVGERIPAFEVEDADGNPRHFENLKGPKGLVLLFVRSADW